MNFRNSKINLEKSTMQLKKKISSWVKEKEKYKN